MKKILPVGTKVEFNYIFGVKLPNKIGEEDIQNGSGIIVGHLYQELYSDDDLSKMNLLGRLVFKVIPKEILVYQVNRDGHLDEIPAEIPAFAVRKCKPCKCGRDD